ncbi:MAG: hypothetical protein WBQ03_04720 [Candidatus Sulfotelmatobacter sp.]
MWCVAELDEDYIVRMEDVLAVYEKPLSAPGTGGVYRPETGGVA